MSKRRLMHLPVAGVAAWLVLVIGLGLTASSFRSLQRQALQHMQSQFENECKDIQRSLQSELASYEHLLRGLRGLFAQPPVSRRDFHNYLSGLELASRYPAALTVVYAQDVPSAQRHAFEELSSHEAAADGYPPLTVKTRGEGTRMHVITYAEPAQALRMLAGLDLASVHPESRAMIEDLRDTGELLTNGNIISGRGDEHLVLRLGIYRKNWPLHTVQQRREAFIGSVGLGVSLERIMKDALSPQVAGKIHFSLHNIGRVGHPESDAVPSMANLLRDSARLYPAQETAWASLMSGAKVTFGSRQFGVYFRAPVTSFESALDQALPFMVLIFGVLITLLLFAFVYSLHRSAVWLESEVQRRTGDLEESNARLRGEMEQRARLEEAVLRVADEERKALGRDLHDDLGQQLTALGFLAESLKRDLENANPPAAEQASRIVNHLGRALAKIRLLAKGLYPISPAAGEEDVGLEQLAAESRDIFSIECRVVGSTSLSGTPGAAQQLYRVAQEAVRNAVKHGKASCVTIELSRVAGKPRMVIADNGSGFDHAAGGSGLGLQIMRSRCHMLGLDLTISRAPNGGARLSIA